MKDLTIKYLPGDRVCFIKTNPLAQDRKIIVMARVTCTFYDTKTKKFRFLLDKFAKEFTEDELFFNFHDAHKFMDGENE